MAEARTDLGLRSCAGAEAMSQREAREGMIAGSPLLRSALITTALDQRAAARSRAAVLSACGATAGHLGRYPDRVDRGAFRLVGRYCMIIQGSLLLGADAWLGYWKGHAARPHHPHSTIYSPAAFRAMTLR